MAAVTAQQLDQAIQSQYSEYYGEKSESALKIKEEIQKVEYDAYKHKIDSLKTIFEKRKEVISGLSNFWSESIMQSSLNPAFIDPQDNEALRSLEHVDCTFESDPRAWTMTFHFGANRFFEDKTLSKTVEVAPGQPRFEQHSLDAELKSKAVPIKWKSDKVNLAKLRPRPKIDEVEETDDFDSTGSFFTFFTEAEDPLELHAHVIEWYITAHDLYARVGNAIEDEDASEDEEDESDDPNAEIDLDEEEPPKKKRRN